MISEDVRAKTLHVISLLEKGPEHEGRLPTLTLCCFEVGISYAQFRLACKNDPDLKAMYQNALALAEDIMADQLVNIDLHHSDPKMAGVVSKNIHWLLARRRRLDYGDHVTVEHTTTRDQELLKRLRDAQERAVAPPALIDGVAEPVSEALPEPPAAELLLPVQPAFDPSDPRQQAAMRALFG
jgi:hypothetical protein